MDLQELRKEIDSVDRQLVALFARRMEIAARVAAYKRQQGLPVLDAGREKSKLEQVAALAPEGLRQQTRILYELLFSLSRSYQESLLERPCDLSRQVEQAPRRELPESADVACPEGEEGLCAHLLPRASVQCFDTAQAVCTCIGAELYPYGIIPAEDVSQAADRGLYILRSIRAGERRYFCVGKELTIVPEARRAALTVTLPDVPGALFQVLVRFYGLDVDITDLGSLPGGRIWLEVKLNGRFSRLLGELSQLCPNLRYLGSYDEVET